MGSRGDLVVPEVYRAFDLDGSGDVGAAEMLALGKVTY